MTTYGPYQNGTIVELSVSNGKGWGGSILYGIVFRAGPKSFCVLWESDHISRYRQTYHLNRAWFGMGMEDFKVEIEAKLQTALGKL